MSLPLRFHHPLVVNLDLIYWLQSLRKPQHLNITGGSIQLKASSLTTGQESKSEDQQSSRIAWRMSSSRDW